MSNPMALACSRGGATGARGRTRTVGGRRQGAVAIDGWVDGEVDAPIQRRALRCPLYDKSHALFPSRNLNASVQERERFQCSPEEAVDNRGKPWLERHRLHCSPPPPRLLYETMKPNRTAWFVGDSLSIQHERAFACRMWAEAAELMHARGGCSLSMEAAAGQRCGALTVRSLAPPLERAVRGRVPSWWCGRPHCIEISLPPHTTFTTCWAQAGGGCYRGSVESVYEVVRRMLKARGVLQQGDLVIMNEGLHHHASPALERWRVKLVADAFRRPSSAFSVGRVRGGVRFAWRETSPQHFEGMPNGSYTGRSAGTLYDPFPRHARCAPLTQPARGELLTWTAAAFEAARVPVIPVWDLSASQHDAHLERRTAYTRGSQTRGADCTHFCEPSSVLAAWVDATLAALHPIDGGPGRAAGRLQQ